ncbi:hypothetical protein PMAYCL1PPCAC_09413, partial [Pristionchus mayeri]
LTGICGETEGQEHEHIPQAVGQYFNAVTFPPSASYSSREEHNKLEEVRTMAKLKNPGIVQYNYAWIEKPPIGWQVQADYDMIKSVGAS